MGLSREEIDQIAKDVAERVVPKAKICRCGVAMWGARSVYSALNHYINFQMPKQLEEGKDSYTTTLNYVAEDCQVNMAEAKKHLNDIIRLSKEEKWSDAFTKQYELRSAIIDPVHKCSRGEE